MQWNGSGVGRVCRFVTGLAVLGFVMEWVVAQPRFGRGAREMEPAEPGRPISVDQVPYYPNHDFYDESVVRTIFLTFDTDEWADELSEIYQFNRTGFDVELAGEMVVDGVAYEGVGVRYRGNTSTMFVPEDRKRSLNLSIDYTKPGQDLYGYSTLNLLNAHTDPTFMREMLFNHIARQYLPASKANYVRLVINGECWGIYINSQQFNRDFLKDWYGTRQGVRWKVPANPRNGNGLAYVSDDPADYQGQYELRGDLKPDAEAAAWDALTELARTMAMAPLKELVSRVEPILNVDRALWFLALENVLIDNDGYWVRASDFAFYQHPRGRFHLVPHDNNETFKLPGGPGFGGEVSGFELDPLIGWDDEGKALIYNLTAVPELRMRYLAHVKTIAEEWLDRDRLGKLVQGYRELIEEDVRLDTKKLESYDDFVAGLREPVGRSPGLKQFAQERRAYLLSYPAIAKPTPVVESVSLQVLRDGRLADGEPTTTDTLEVVAQVGLEVRPSHVYLYHSASRHEPFASVALQSEQAGLYRGRLPSAPAGEPIYYYVEARHAGHETTVFYPRAAEFGAMTVAYGPGVGRGGEVFISEVMAANTESLSDPQGDFDDWIELFNPTDQDVDLSGMYLTDNPDRPRKWRFPAGTVIGAKGCLLLWADEDGGATEGVHLNFKLSRGGEQILLIDTDGRHNVILDRFEFGEVERDVSLTRSGKGAGPRPASLPTPGRSNPQR